MRRHFSFFTRMFLVLLTLIVILVSTVAIFSSQTLLRYSQTQISELSIENVLNTATKLDMLSESLAWNGMYLMLLLNDASKSGMTSGSVYSDEAMNILFRKNVYTTLAAIAKANTSFASVYLYHESTGSVITSDATFAQVEDFPDIDWLQAYATQKSIEGFWLPSRRISMATNTSSFLRERVQCVLTYVYPLSGYLTPQPNRGLVIFNLYESAISSLLNTSGDEKAERTLLITKNGEIISDTLKGYIGTNLAREADIAQVLASKEKSGYIIDRTKKEPMMLIYCDVGINNNWRIIRYAPLERLYATANNSLRVLILATVLISLIAMVVVWLISQHFSRPLIEMKETIQKSDRFASASPDETHLINHTLNYLMREEARLSSELAQRKATRKNFVLQTLFVQGDSMAVQWDDPIIEQLDASSNLAVYLSDDLQASMLHEKSQEEQAEYKSLVARLCEETIRMEGMEFSSLPVFHRDLLVIIHMKQEPDALAVEKILNNLRTFVESTYRTLHISTTIGVSSAFSGARTAHAAFEEARIAARQKLIMGRRQVIEYTQVPQPTNQYFFPSVQEKQVLSALAAGKKDAAVEGIHQLFATLKKRKDLTAENAMLVIQLFVATLVRQINDENHLSVLPIPEGIHILDKVYFSYIETLDDIDQFLSEEIASMFDRMLAIQPSKETLIDRMMAFIHKNYVNNIGIEDIASNLGISYSYTRHVFSENTGRNLVDYINELRIQAAKEYLVTSQKNISEIASLVGYNNEQSFTRFFKKYSHVLPSQYRKEQTPIK